MKCGLGARQGTCFHQRPCVASAARPAITVVSARPPWPKAVHRGPDDGRRPRRRAPRRRHRRAPSEHHRRRGGHQPLANEDGTVWAALNGEIYNYRGCARSCSPRPPARDALRHRGARAPLRGLRADLVHALEGMFAFAIWDSAGESLLVARDRFGEKPLFYDTTRRRALVRLRAVRAARGCGDRGELDPRAVRRLLHARLRPGRAHDVRRASASCQPGTCCAGRWREPRGCARGTGSCLRSRPPARASLEDLVDERERPARALGAQPPGRRRPARVLLSAAGWTRRSSPRSRARHRPAGQDLHRRLRHRHGERGRPARATAAAAGHRAPRAARSRRRGSPRTCPRLLARSISRSPTRRSSRSRRSRSSLASTSPSRSAAREPTSCSSATRAIAGSHAPTASAARPRRRSAAAATVRPAGSAPGARGG